MKLNRLGHKTQVHKQLVKPLMADTANPAEFTLQLASIQVALLTDIAASLRVIANYGDKS